MRHWISGLLYLIVILVYLLIKDYELLFMLIAWQTGYWKEVFRSNDTVNQG